jgi:restriction system protein
MLGFGALGTMALGSGPRSTPSQIQKGSETVKLSISGIIIPERRVSEGVLLKSTSTIWTEIARKLAADWSVAYQLSSENWDEIVAGAFSKSGYDVILTPRSGDHGRDVIATKSGVGCVKIIGSVKAYRPGNLVPYDDVRALLGVMSGERDVSKGIITTTSDFPPNIEKDPYIAPFLPTRLELMNSTQLQSWLSEIQSEGAP